MPGRWADAVAAAAAEVPGIKFLFLPLLLQRSLVNIIAEVFRPNTHRHHTPFCPVHSASYIVLCVHIAFILYSRKQGNKDESTALSSAFDDLRIFGLVIFPLYGSRAHIRALLLRGSPPPIPEFGRVRFQSAVRGSSYRGFVNTHTHTYYIYVYNIVVVYYIRSARTNALTQCYRRQSTNRCSRGEAPKHHNNNNIRRHLYNIMYSRCKRARR